jgi:inner membrane protein
MASAFTHAIAAASLGTAFPRPRSLRFWIYGIICSVIPDLDVMGFGFGISYEDMLGHRGLTHSIAFAIVLSGAATILIRSGEQGLPWPLLWFYLFLATISHGILDAFTNGGLGVAFFAPFSNLRYFFPFRPLEVSPIGLNWFFSARGWAVIKNEMVWVWVPALAFALTMGLLQKRQSRKDATF